MSVVVINQLHFFKPVDALVPAIQAAFPPAFDALDGFERFELVKVAEDRAVALIHWRDGAAAQAGAAAIGPTVFAQLVGPNLASDQVRVVGPVVVGHEAAPGG